MDNLLKFVNDLLTGVVWEDDSQIFELMATKEHGPESGIHLRVWILDRGHPCGSPAQRAGFLVEYNGSALKAAEEKED